MSRHRLLLGFLGCLIPVLAWSQSNSPSRVLQAMKEELQRSFDALKTQTTAPYFLSYTITEQKRRSVSAAFGALHGSSEGTTRQLAIDLRVGDYQLDNTHEIRGDFGSFIPRYSFIQIPIEDDVDAIKTILWLETDKKYKRAVEQFTKVKTNKAVKVTEEDTSADFSHQKPGVFVEQSNSMSVDRALWEAKLKKYTDVFRVHPNIYDGQATFDALVETRYYVNSEGTMLQTSQPYVRLFINAFSKADDGMELPRYESFFAFSPEGMPSDEVVIKKAEKMIEDMEKLRTAPLVEPYTGPAILLGGAAGVFFHEVFGHRVEGHRQKSVSEGQTFKKMLGEKILPATMDVIYDPTVDRINGVDLSGHYKYDDEGVKAERVVVVENGVFKSFLMGRSPVEKFPSSNGHGRAQAGYSAVARQSNLIVQSKDPVAVAKLRQMLIEDCKSQKKPYGLVFAQIQGGFTITGRTIPNAFNVLPLVVYKVYTDGRPDEIVRGVDLVGTPLTAFSKVAAAGDDPETWYGFCGAESGFVPVSQTCPSILISQIEVQKKTKSQEKPPILPAPRDKKAG